MQLVEIFENHLIIDNTKFFCQNTVLNIERIVKIYLSQSKWEVCSILVASGFCLNNLKKCLKKLEALYLWKNISILRQVWDCQLVLLPPDGRTIIYR